MRRTLYLLFVLAALICIPAQAADWPQFRGASGDGVSSEKIAPTQWDQQKNVRWKASLPGPGNSSPIVSASRVFITCAEDKGQKRSLYCFDRKSGKQLWIRTVAYGKVATTHKTNPYCASTPLADGKRVVVWHGSAGLYCYDFEGNQLWQRDLGQVDHAWGYAASPVLYGDRILLNRGPGQGTALMALDFASGKTVWETPEQLGGNGKNRDDGANIGSWCTPIVIKVDGKDQILCAMPTRINAYDPANGQILWSCQGLAHNRGDLVYSSPVVADGLGIVIGGYRGPGIGFKLGGSGDVTEKNRLWRNENQPQSIGTGVVVGKHLYRPNAGPGTIECVEIATGKVVWTNRSPGGNQWGSIVRVGENLYVTGQNGTTTVFKANPNKYEQVSANRLGESSNSTPAISDGQIFIRTDGHLWCIAEAATQ